jgi:hypothetical protein
MSDADIGESRASDMPRPRQKTFQQMSSAERDAVVARFDQETDYSKTKALSPRGKALWNAAQRATPRQPTESGAARMLITIDRQLLDTVDEFVRRHGKSRSELVAEGLRLAMGTRRAKAS